MRHLRTCTVSSGWPERGVYFFFERCEIRSGPSTGLRVVRVGTHAVSEGAHSTLWNRLAQHKGTSALGGNHRGSVFRKLVGQALAHREPKLAVATWGKEQSAPRAIRDAELALEQEVSRYIGEMPFLCLAVGDSASTASRRAYIERNSISLLSNASSPHGACADAPSASWLGLWCPHFDVPRSGLWNSRGVNDPYEPLFLDELERLVG
jgi:hypothetical protein